MLFELDEDDVYITSACIAGWKYEDATEIWYRVAKHFGSSFFLEYQANNTDEQKKINSIIYELSQSAGIKTIIGLDTHYISEEDRIKRDNLLKRKGIRYPEENGWYMDPFFKEHKDTAQLAYNMNAFKPGDTIYITRKMHGTSARTAKTVKVEDKNSFVRTLLRMKPKKEKNIAIVSGSRRVILEDVTRNDGYYSDNSFRRKYHELLKNRIPEGMEIFYEIVGWVNESTPIMPSVSNKKVKDKEFSKKFGDSTIFAYGCEPGESEMYVYRMTMTSPDGTVIELPWETVKIWCEKLGVNHVPELEKFMFTTQEDLKERVDKYITGMPADEIGKTHIAEGVVVRIDNRESFTAFKDKCFEFKVCEGIIKDTSDVPDMEEAEEVMEENISA